MRLVELFSDKTKKNAAPPKLYRCDLWQKKYIVSVCVCQLFYEHARAYVESLLYDKHTMNYI